jgi:hypothetical protein
MCGYDKTRNVTRIIVTDRRVRYVVRSIQPCLDESSAPSQHTVRTSRDVLKTEAAPS